MEIQGEAIRPQSNAARCAGGVKVVQENVVQGTGASKEKVDEQKTEDVVVGNGKEVLGIEDDDELAEPEVPVEDHGGDLPRAMKAPSPPSRQEALEHRILHCPFRAWCPECVAGKSKCNPHLTSNRDTEQSVPVVAFDYAFMGDDSVASESEE